MAIVRTGFSSERNRESVEGFGQRISPIVIGSSAGLGWKQGDPLGGSHREARVV